jgi:6-pyruvoyl tetrahydropterin synthase/QueD family protein
VAGITVRHNVEMAHRLFTTPGKCENIHGHSWWVELTIYGDIGEETGMLEGLDFGMVKRHLRTYLDSGFDHRVLLNERDPFAGDLNILHYSTRGEDVETDEPAIHLPGMVAMHGDPTTENFAHMIGLAMAGLFKLPVRVDVWETSVNKAFWSNLDDVTSS